jgi:1-aminocyclopropane-1-carboxylate synthase
MSADLSTNTLSTRGKRCVLPALSYLGMHFAGMNDLLTAPSSTTLTGEDDGTGYVLLDIAENKLNVSAAVAKLQAVEAATAAESAARADSKAIGDAASAVVAGSLPHMNASEGIIRREGGLGYDSGLGRPAFRAAFAEIMSSTLLSPPLRTVSSASPIISPSNFIVASGVGSLLQNLAVLLCNAGDGVLLPSPTYAALYNDMTVLAGAVIFDLPMEATGYKLTPALLEGGLERATAAGSAVKVLLILNPENPLGIVHTPGEIRECIRWCRTHSIHCIIDEIYANSVHSPDLSEEPFQSAVEIAWHMHRDAGAHPGEAFMGDYVHVLWGLSKDWGMSGIRVGALFTHNNSILEAMSNINYFSGVSNYLQDMLTDVMRDKSWCFSFLERNRFLLKRSYDLVTSLLQSAGIPFVPAPAGLYVWLDLSAYLQPVEGVISFASERELTKGMFQHAHIVLTPGEACHAHPHTPGRYRCCFAWMEPECVAIGIKRMIKYLATLPTRTDNVDNKDNRNGQAIK